MKKFLQQLSEFIEKYRKQITYVLFLFSAVLVFAIYNSINAPIEFNYFENRIQKIHYSNSPKYFLLEKQRDSLLNAFSIELMNNIAQLPVVFWSLNGDSLIASNVIDPFTDSLQTRNTIFQMKKNNQPVEINLGDSQKGIIYYSNSKILFQFLKVLRK